MSDQNATPLSVEPLPAVAYAIRLFHADENRTERLAARDAYPQLTVIERLAAQDLKEMIDNKTLAAVLLLNDVYAVLLAKRESQENAYRIEKAQEDRRCRQAWAIFGMLIAHEVILMPEPSAPDFDRLHVEHTILTLAAALGTLED